MMYMRKDACRFDLLSLGALVTRYDPGDIPLREAKHFDIHVSGGEYNVASNLSHCFGMKTAVVSAIVRNDFRGDIIEREVRSRGVTGLYKEFINDGMRGPTHAIVYSNRSHGVRAPEVEYNRANEAAALLKPGDFEWNEIFGDGVRWFHSGGIFASLSESTSELIIEGMKMAKQANAVTSFDINFRQKLWVARGGIEIAQKTYDSILPYVDVLVGNEEDLQMGLSIKGPEVRKSSKLDPSKFIAMIDDVVCKYENIHAVATTLRNVHSADKHSWGAVAWIDGKTYQYPQFDADTGGIDPKFCIDVYDRVGGGDACASGLFYGLMRGFDPAYAIRIGRESGAHLVTTPGDVLMAKWPEIKSLCQDGSARIAR